jgi:DNA-binding HxlR family transcriptional regulator
MGTGSLPEPLNSVPWDSAARHCPIRDLLAHLGDKWSMLVLVALAQHPERTLRFSGLTGSVNGISQRMLTTTLRYLERDGILTRRLYPEVPPRVEYTLSGRGSRLWYQSKQSSPGFRTNGLRSKNRVMSMTSDMGEVRATSVRARNERSQ